MILETWRRGIRIRNPAGPSRAPSATRGEVRQFSDVSRRRLSWIYAQGPWVSMITLTYHNDFPDPVEGKRQLGRWLEGLTRRGIRYLWVLEWQRRGVPHYHVWLDHSFADCPLSEDKIRQHSWRPLMESWLRISGQDSDDAARSFSLHQRSYVDWEIRVGNNYAAKYAEKQQQKGLPPGVETYGRWWGCSRGVNLPESVRIIDVDPESPDCQLTESVIYRRQVRRALSAWKNRPRRGNTLSGLSYSACPARQCALAALESSYLPEKPRSLDSDRFLRERTRRYRISGNCWGVRDSRYSSFADFARVSPLYVSFPVDGPLGSAYFLSMYIHGHIFLDSDAQNGSVCDDLLARFVRCYYDGATMRPTQLGAIHGAYNVVARLHDNMRRFGHSDQFCKTCLNTLARLFSQGYIYVSADLGDVLTDWRNNAKL